MDAVAEFVRALGLNSADSIDGSSILELEETELALARVAPPGVHAAVLHSPPSRPANADDA